MKPLVAMGAVIGALCLFILGVRALQARRHVGSEFGRKLVHGGMGVIAVSFPWIFMDSRPVWFLAIVSIAILGTIRYVPSVARRFGSVLGGVDRASLGDVLFPLGLASAFTLAHGDKAAFCAAAGVLALGDTAGALVGVRWGRTRFSIAGTTKSVEGSIAVLAVSFLCVTLAFAALGTTALAVSIAAGLIVGLAAALVEAVSSYGLDNFLLPITVVELMRHWAA
jgi:phytol kinase